MIDTKTGTTSTTKTLTATKTSTATKSIVTTIDNRMSPMPMSRITPQKGYGFEFKPPKEPKIPKIPPPIKIPNLDIDLRKPIRQKQIKRGRIYKERQFNVLELTSAMQGTSQQRKKQKINNQLNYIKNIF